MIFQTAARTLRASVLRRVSRGVNVKVPWSRPIVHFTVEA
jgi:hypothetical protein